MKILFSALHFACFRNFESAIRALAERGHHIHLAADEDEMLGGRALVERLASEYESITFGFTPPLDRDPWSAAAQKLRFSLDYVRFLDPRYDAAPKLQARSVERASRVVRWLTVPVAGMRPMRRLVESALKGAERALPPSTAVEEWMHERQPDVVLLASLTVSRSSSLDQLKAARALRVPVGACIMSWDHLSSKALLHIHPDLTLVWNEVQKREAIDMHRIPAERIAVTGAQCYDQWFSRRPHRSREDFCRAVGLAPDRPFILYVCSTMSPVPNPPEPFFVKEWAASVRSSADPVLRNAGLLIRPHPERLKDWNEISLDGLDNVVVHGTNPIDSEAKTDYFDALYHSAAVVGICTSVFLEAAIVGRRVLALCVPRFSIHQEMAHFQYLLDVEGGLLETGSLEAHLRQLSEALSAPPGRDERNRRFLTAFVRPAGLDREATPMFVEQVEQLATVATLQPSPAASAPARAFVTRLAVASNYGIGRWLFMDGIDEGRARSEREGGRLKQQILQKRADYRDGKARKREEMIRATEDQRRAKEWRKWRRGLSARKQVARLKGGVKQLIGARHQ